jgi:hypothetical protein
MNPQLNATLLDSFIADHIRAAAEARALPEYRSQRSRIGRRRHRETR